MKKLQTGLLITFEGIDGSGKSTLIQNIADKFSKKYAPIITTKQPGGTEIGSQIRTLVQTKKNGLCQQTELLLFAADRAQHVQTVIKPALKAHSLILCDRFADSSVAYQGYGRKMPLAFIDLLNTYALDGIKPNLIFYLKIDPVAAFDRIKKRNEALTAFEQEKVDFFVRVKNGYELIFKNNPTVITLDANESPENLCNQALKTLTEHFGL